MVTAGIESPGGGLYEQVSRAPLAWPLDGQVLETLRGVLEDYLLALFRVRKNRGPLMRHVASASVPRRLSFIATWR
jgi:hypothetical protein